MRKYILQTKHTIDAVWNDAKFVDCKDGREACELAGREEEKFNAEIGVKDKQSPNWIQVRAVPRNKDYECAGA